MVFAVKQETGQRFAQLGFTHAGRAQEQEAAVRLVRVGKARAAAANGVGHGAHSFVLSHHALVQYVFHAQQFFAFAFHHFRYGNSRHARHDFGNFFRAHFGAEQCVGRFQAACTLHFFQLQSQFGQFSVFQLRSLAVIAHTLGLLDFMFDFVDVRLQIGQVHGRGFFSLPHFIQIGIFFFQTGNFFVNQSQTLFARLVAFFGNVHFFHFQLDDAAVELVHLLGFGFFLDFDAAGRFVNQINGFIR